MGTEPVGRLRPHIDTGVAVAVMRNRFSPDFDTVARIDGLVPKTHPPPPHDPGVDVSEPHVELDTRFSDPGTSPTSWEQTVETIAGAQLFWISSTPADGRPHVSPLVAVWVDDSLYFATGPSEQKAINLRANPEVVLTTGVNSWDEGLDVVDAGTARRVVGRDDLVRLAQAWAVKWDGRWH